jgi:hypothetical protein
MKSCRICGKEKPLTDFYKTPGAADGHRTQCKSCDKAIEAKLRFERRQFGDPVINTALKLWNSRPLP